MMSQSMATYVLSKYSRSYPPPFEKSGDVNPEWQHFVNPVIQLTLETKKGSKGDLESLRLRILWLVERGGILNGTGQDEVVFEDLELLSFPSRSPGNSFANQALCKSLPLKAVYRDALVGIRYLHSQNPAVYRRFQITFESNLAASQFLDAIRIVCPCKLNPPPAPVRSTTLAPARTQRPENPLPNPPTPGLARTLTFAPSGRHVTSSTLHSVPQSSSPQFSSSPNFQMSSELDVSSIVHFESTTQRSTASSKTLLPRDEQNATQTSFTLEPSLRPNFQRNTVVDPVVMQDVSAAAPSLQPSLFSSTRDNHTIMPPPPPPPPPQEPLQPTPESLPAPPSEPPNVSTFIESIRKESSILLNLPPPELEKLVVEVVQEPGFPKLLETLDSMLMAKGYLGRY